MENVFELRRRLLVSLQDLGLCQDSDGDQTTEDNVNKNSGNWRVVKACLCAGLYPNVAHGMSEREGTRREIEKKEKKGRERERNKRERI